MHKEKSTQFVSFKKLNTVPWNVSSPESLMPPLCYRNELIALYVTWYHVAVLLNNPNNIFGRLSLAFFWLSLLQKAFSAQPGYLGFSSPPPPATIRSLFLLFSSPDSTLFSLQISSFDHRVFVGYKFLLMVQMHCKILGRLNLCWHALYSPLWTCINLAKAWYQVPWLIQQRYSHVSLPDQHHLFCWVPRVY